MARITQAQWKKYISRLRQINDTAADEFREYVIGQGGYASMDRQLLIDYAYGISTKYGEASAALSAQMYDAVAELSGVTVPAAVPAETATRAEVSRTVNGIIKNTQSNEVLAQGVGKLVKQAGADTILANAYRDRPKGKGSKRRHSGAKVAWIPSGDTCPFCLTLASKGWQNQTEWSANSHAEHIHANCDCTYGVKFNDKLDYDGYDPEEYKKMYDNAEGSTRDEKINSMRRMQYEDPSARNKIREQQKISYANRKLDETLNSISLSDVTQEYLEKSSPGKGFLKKQAGFSNNNGEEAIANWLFDKFGGKITILAEKNQDNVLNPDYLWNNRYWDLKSPETSKANTIDLRIRHGVLQINDNPGGVILDFSKSNLSFSEAIKAVDESGKKRAKKTMDFIVKKDENFRVLRVIK